jgi:hypothetical protein
MSENYFSFDVLDSADLCVDAVYYGGKTANLSSEPLSKLVGVGNAGGFRPIAGGTPRKVT